MIRYIISICKFEGLLVTRIGFEDHNHDSCVKEALHAAETHCLDRKLQFTKVRRRVLEILLSEHKALGAYDILARLTDEGIGSQPPVAYRALDFLVSHGFVHRIEKMNAYIACTLPGEPHSPAFMICRVCDAVVEAQPPAGDALNQTARDLGFQIENTVLEAEGICPACADEGAAE